jgi:hypothetical protein
MKFYVADVDFSGTFDILVEADNESEAHILACDEAKKRIKSPHTLEISVYSVEESDEK